MNKRAMLTVCDLLIVLLCACLFAACNGTNDDNKPTSCTVTFDFGAYEGNGKAPASVTAEKDSKLNLPTPDKLPAWEGHTFEGWKLGGEGDLLAGGAEITVTADAKYVAEWKREYEKGSIYEIVPEEELKHIIGYVYTMGKQEGHSANFVLPYYHTGTKDSSGVDLLGYIAIGNRVGGDGTGGMVVLFDSEKHAIANRDYWLNYGPESYEKETKVVGNRIYYGCPSGEEWYDYYVNTILALEIPQSLSETRLNYMLDSATHGEYASAISMAVRTNYKNPYFKDAIPESGESFVYSLSESDDDSTTNMYAYCTSKEANDLNNGDFGKLESEINTNGDEGSYVDKKREEGFVFFRYIEKQA